jgi:hypothetical protein
MSLLPGPRDLQLLWVVSNVMWLVIHRKLIKACRFRYLDCSKGQSLIQPLTPVLHRYRGSLDRIHAHAIFCFVHNGKCYTSWQVYSTDLYDKIYQDLWNIKDLHGSAVFAKVVMS